MKLNIFKRKKLNNKGFTLIELLAVIVILAVVMGVATTSVLSAMNNSRKSSLQDSALSAADGFRTSYAEYSMNSDNGLVGNKTAATNNALLNGTAQSLSNYKTGLNITDSNYDLTASKVYFNKTESTFTVCLVAKTTGSYYVANAVKTTDTNITGIGTMAKNTMWACSENSKSW